MYRWITLLEPETNTMFLYSNLSKRGGGQEEDGP